MTATTDAGAAHESERSGRMPQRARRSRQGASMREEILNAAREQFASQGYDRTSVRSVAGAAGVDPALVHHYFGGKEKLFAEAVALPAVPSELLQVVLEGDRERIAERWLRALFGLWATEPGAESRMAAAVRTLTSGGAQADTLRDFLARHILGRVATALGVDHPELRAAMAASQVLGLFTARSVVGIEPLANADTEWLVACYAPVVQRLLTGPLPEARGPG